MVARVEIRRAAFVAPVEAVLRRHALGVERVVVDRVRPGVIRAELHPAAQPLCRADPQPVVAGISDAVDRVDVRETGVWPHAVDELVHVPRHAEVRPLRPEIADLHAEVLHDFPLEIEVPGLHVVVPEIPADVGGA